MKKLWGLVGILILCAGSVFASENASSLPNPVWGLSVQGLSSSGVGLRYKTASSAWLLDFSTSGSTDRETEPNGPGEIRTSETHYRAYSYGLAWRKYYSNDAVRFFIQPGLESWKWTYESTYCPDCSSSVQTRRSLGASLNVGAEVFLSSNWSVEGFAGFAYSASTYVQSDRGFSQYSENIPDPETRRKDFRSVASLAISFYWD